jgi:nicotinate-nucleotide adenylyltransferase
MTAARRIGILGGTFDPILIGHLDLALAAEQRLGLTELIVVPSHIPPHRPQPQASGFHRFAMAAMTVGGRPGWQASDLELRIDGPSYTTDTIRHFHERGCRASELFFILGADAFAEIGTWKDYPEILERANFAVVSRPGHPAGESPSRVPQLASRMRRAPIDHHRDPASRAVLDVANNHAATAASPPVVIILIDAPTASVSATAIRQRCAAGGSIAGMVDPRVQQHIEQHGLYTSIAPGRRGDEQVDIPAAGRLHGQG